MSEVRIDAENREEFGKGAARRLRRDGKIPAVVYGHGTDPKHVALPGHELILALRTPNVLLNLQLSDGEQLVLPKSVQRDPVRYTLEHVDLVVVNKGEKVTIEVPVVTVGTQAPGGLLEHAQTLTVEAEATHIPTEITVDVEGLVIGDSVHAKDIKLPEGVILIADEDTVVVHVLEPKVVTETTAGEETAEPAADAPAETPES